MKQSVNASWGNDWHNKNLVKIVQDYSRSLQKRWFCLYLFSAFALFSIFCPYLAPSNHPLLNVEESKKKRYKGTYLQNRNRLTTVERKNSKFREKTYGSWGKKGEGIVGECGINMYALLSFRMENQQGSAA